MDSLYPPIEPDRTGHLDVGDGHRVYWETSGNPDGKPVVVLHGGPGAGTNPMQRRHFDPTAYRIVLFDQRGAGRSTPFAATHANTTWHLVADMERLREHLGVERWQLFGGSWGSTLAVAYAETHPDRVTEVVLRGVFLLRERELDWLYRGGAGALFPEAWSRFLSLVTPGTDPLHAYHTLLDGPDPTAAAIAWSAWEGTTVSLLPNPAMVAHYEHPRFAVPFARLALHYFLNHGWLEENQLIRDAPKLAHIPATFIQGRYDAVCPPMTAWDLHQAWPGSTLTILPTAGHTVADPGVLTALRAATDGYR
ncbi:prolyl aminopeptidase [Actinokineospora guangxiensis]|uniref:Proline iminopeptidase n=1 Tax=Actinokineospora guangxiensis TaxID=1490288 RepID=A0ABW0EN83_9PSEU